VRHLEALRPLAFTERSTEEVNESKLRNMLLLGVIKTCNMGPQLLMLRDHPLLNSYVRSSIDLMVPVSRSRSHVY
jgi:hypothetical protein